MVEGDLLFQLADLHLDILYPGHLLSDHNHLDIHLLWAVFALDQARLFLYSTVAFPHLLLDRHNNLVAEGSSGSVADNHSLCLLHSFLDTPHFHYNPAHTHYRSLHIRTHPGDIDRSLVEGTVAGADEAGHSLVEDQVSVRHARCMAVLEVDSCLDRKPLSC